MTRISQIDLVSAIMLHLKKKERIKSIPHRQVNAIIQAANIVVDAMADEYRPATADAGIESWINSDETGMSSKYMAHALAAPAGVLSAKGVASGIICSRAEAEEMNHPHDPSDFGRCVGLLTAVPELRPHIHLLTNGHGWQWAALASNWDRLEVLYREELPIGKCPKLYAEMQRLLDGKD